MSGIFEDIFLYKALGRDGFFLVIFGIPIAIGIFQYNLMQTRSGDSKSFSEPNPGTVNHYGAKLGQRAQKFEVLVWPLISHEDEFTAVLLSGQSNRLGFSADFHRSFKWNASQPQQFLGRCQLLLTKFRAQSPELPFWEAHGHMA